MEQNNFLYGVVEDINDPDKVGKVRVRFFNIHSDLKLKTDNEGSATSDLNWCHTIMPTTGCSMSGLGQTHQLKQGSFVIGIAFDEMLEEVFIMGTVKGIPAIKPNSQTGFSDPSGKFPLADYIKESDENRLSRNENIEKTIVKAKRDSTEKNIKRANDLDPYNEPETTYNAKYTKNNVSESESGHIFEIDDTEGAERIHQYHKSGSFDEIHSDGTKIVKIVGDDYTIVEKNGFTLIKGNFDITIIGNLSLKVEGDVEAEVTGNLNANIEKNADISVGGNSNHTVTGNVNEIITGDYTQTVEGDIKISAKNASYNIKQDNTLDARDINENASASIKSIAKSSNVIKGSSVYLN